MNTRTRRIIPVVVTLLVVLAAGLVLKNLWQYYMRDPWTRDARISADVIQVAPDVSGLVSEVQVRDNASVHRGDVLFVIDPARYRIALEHARATALQNQAAQAQALAQVAQAQAAQRQLQREAARDRTLKDLVATEVIETRSAGLEKADAAVAAAQASVAAAQAAMATARAAVELAELNMARTVIRSPVDGRVNDRTVRPGDYVTAGKPVLAVLDTASFRVDGYFEETRLQGIRTNDPVDIHVMGEPTVLHGHVSSIAAGITDRYRTDGTNLLPNVTPAFDWVRLAQRIPVRISIDERPESVELISGRTATVSIVGTARDRQQAASQDRHPS